MSRRKRKLVILSVIAVITVALYAWGYAMKTEDYCVYSDKVDSGLKIVFVTDLHNCFYGGFDQSGLIDAIDDEEPDIVVFGGDMIDQYGGTKYALRLMKAAADKYPCFYSPGNHELIRSDSPDFYKDVQSLGVKLLAGNYSELEVRGQPVRVYGIYEARYKSQLKKCAATLDDGYYNILLSHQPEQYEELRDTGKVKFDLILCGHAHGGQWRIPKLLEQGIYAPDQGIFPERTGGMYDEDGSVQIVSRGLAKPLRMIFVPRIFNRPELSVIEVKKQAS